MKPRRRDSSRFSFCLKVSKIKRLVGSGTDFSKILNNHRFRWFPKKFWYFPIKNSKKLSVLQPDDTLQLVLEAEPEEEKCFYELERIVYDALNNDIVEKLIKGKAGAWERLRQLLKTKRWWKVGIIQREEM